MDSMHLSSLIWTPIISWEKVKISITQTGNSIQYFKCISSCKNCYHKQLIHVLDVMNVTHKLYEVNTYFLHYWKNEPPPKIAALNKINLPLRRTCRIPKHINYVPYLHSKYSLLRHSVA